MCNTKVISSIYANALMPPLIFNVLVLLGFVGDRFAPSAAAGEIPMKI